MTDYGKAPPPQVNYGYPPQGPAYEGAVQQQPMSGHTTVVVQQPVFGASASKREWSSKVMDCTADMGVCCFGYFCGICQACQLAGDMGESSCVPCCVPAYLIPLRTKLRVEQNIEGSIMDDCLMVSCCGPCVQCQMVREVKMLQTRGFYQMTQH